jgi:hypothetical protein
VVIMEFGILLAPEPQRDMARHPKIIAEEILDHLALVAKAEHELVKAALGIDLHDMPQNGAVADGHHRFGAVFGFLPQTGAFSSAQDDDFHIFRFKSKKRQDNDGRQGCKPILTRQRLPSVRLLILILQRRGQATPTPDQT